MVCVPTAKTLPEGDEGAKLVTEQLSKLVGAVQLTTVPQESAPANTEMSEGRPSMAGFCSSEMVTTKVEVVSFPTESVAV